MNSNEILLSSINNNDKQMMNITVEMSKEYHEFPTCTTMDIESESLPIVDEYSTEDVELIKVSNYSNSSLAYDSDSLTNLSDNSNMSFETQRALSPKFNECSAPLESIPELADSEDHEELMNRNSEEQIYDLSDDQCVNGELENYLGNSPNAEEMSSKLVFKDSTNIIPSETEHIKSEFQNVQSCSQEEQYVQIETTIMQKTIFKDENLINHKEEEDEEREQEEWRLNEDKILAEENEEANDQEKFSEEKAIYKEEDQNKLDENQKENEDEREEILKAEKEDEIQEEDEEELDSMQNSSSLAFDPLSMFLSEEEESLWEDFGAYLSTLPPRCLSDSDSLSFDFPEEFLDPPGDMLTTKPQLTEAKQNCLTRKQWQSCFDLFLNRNRPHIFKVTSKMLFKRQSSWADKNSDLLRSLQERLMKMRSLSEQDTYSNSSATSSPTHTSILKRISNMKEGKGVGRGESERGGIFDSSFNGLASENQSKDGKNKLLLKRSV